MTTTGAKGNIGIQRVFLDTNILIRASVVTAPLHLAAKDALAELWNSGAELWISRQVIREFVANASRPQTYSPAIPMPVIDEQVQNFVSQFRVADDTAAVTTQLFRLLKDIPVGGRQVHDANIVATMLVNDVGVLITHNVTDFKRFSHLVSIRPL